MNLPFVLLCLYNTCKLYADHLKLHTELQAHADYSTLEGKLHYIIRLVGQMAARHFAQEMQRFMCWKAYTPFSKYTTKR